MAAIPRLLLLGEDLILLQTRKMILSTRFAVSVSARTSEAANLIGEGGIDLLVIFRASGNWRRFAEAVSQENRRPRILAVTLTEDEAPEWADAVISCAKGPYELLKLCEGLFGMAARSLKSHGFSRGRSKRPVPTA